MDTKQFLDFIRPFLAMASLKSSRLWRCSFGLTKRFDFHTYIYNMVRHNRLATEQGFVPCSCSGIGFLEGVLARMRSNRAFVCLSDICEESTVRHGGAWFKRRVFTVFVLARYDTRREDDYRERLALCRELTEPSAIKRKNRCAKQRYISIFLNDIYVIKESSAAFIETFCKRVLHNFSICVSIHL